MLPSAALQVMRRYHIQDRDDYKKYNKLCGMVTKVTNIIKKLGSRDAVRIELTEQLLDKCVKLQHALLRCFPAFGCAGCMSVPAASAVS